MITIQTVTTKLLNNDGTPASGSIVLMPSKSFSFIDTDGIRKKVVKERITARFANGLLTPFQLPPTRNASQDENNLYYTANFITQSASWVEIWVIDDGWSNRTIEVTDVIKVFTQSIFSVRNYLLADQASVKSVGSMIPRGNASGALDASWIPGLSGASIVQFFVQSTAPAGLPSNVIALWNDTTNQQMNVWDGAAWRIIA